MPNAIRIVLVLSLCCVILACQKPKEKVVMLDQQTFGTLPDGKSALIFTLTNHHGMQVRITNYGAAVVSVLAPDAHGAFDDVVLGYDSLSGYVNDKSYLGVIVGRYGNRIGKGKFTLDGSEYQATVNDGENHLHGGAHGFHKVLWDAESSQTDSTQSVKLTHKSPDGDEGYPGNISIEATYTLTDKNELIVEYRGTTDKITILNPTHHSYFNLTGSPTNTILDHQLQIESDSITPVDNGLITTGVLTAVEKTPMDFRELIAIGAHINDASEQLTFGKGYDHNWVLRNQNGKVRKAAVVVEPTSGRVMTVFTDQPGLQFYSGNFLDGSIVGKKNIAYKHRTGICLEAQRYPDSPNKPQFPSVTLKPGEVYRQTTIYQFSTR
ncbi:MAG: galactose mutarotase [Ignavibacteriae bacterium]|nr:galactose mutarotase [Ignavibacteriota bacterium]